MSISVVVVLVKMDGAKVIEMAEQADESARLQQSSGQGGGISLIRTPRENTGALPSGANGGCSGNTGPTNLSKERKEEVEKIVAGLPEQLLALPGNTTWGDIQGEFKKIRKMSKQEHADYWDNFKQVAELLGIRKRGVPINDMLGSMRRPSSKAPVTPETRRPPPDSTNSSPEVMGWGSPGNKELDSSSSSSASGGTVVAKTPAIPNFGAAIKREEVEPPRGGSPPEETVAVVSSKTDTPAFPWPSQPGTVTYVHKGTTVASLALKAKQLALSPGRALGNYLTGRGADPPTKKGALRTGVPPSALKKASVAPQPVRLTHKWKEVVQGSSLPSNAEITTDGAGKTLARLKMEPLDVGEYLPRGARKDLYDSFRRHKRLWKIQMVGLYNAVNPGAVKDTE